MNIVFNSGFIFFILLYCNTSFAGGPLVIEGADGNTPVSYQDTDVSLDVENGDLGELITNAEANNLVQQALNLWNDVATSKLQLSLNNSINLDINEDNYGTYIPDNDSSTAQDNDNFNPLIYDKNGMIIDAFFGLQSSNILGFAASSVSIGNDYFEEGLVVINGLNFGYTDTQYVLLFAHEIGHFFGLDHSQSDINNQESQFGPTYYCSSGRSSYPLMYPIACRTAVSLHSDDISAVSALYPDANINNSLGILEGRLLTDIGGALLGANIWAEDVWTGEAYSIVSDYLLQGTGFYKLHLPEGNYTLHANSINTEFIAGSGVGPYSTSLDDISFIKPHPITAFTYLDDVGNDEIITIAANRTLTVDFNSIDISPPLPSSNKSSGLISIQLTLALFLTILPLRGRQLKLNRRFNPF
jgi:hypothetical protein